MRVTQSNGRPFPIGGFTRRVMAQMLHEVAGGDPKEVLIMSDQEVVVELEEETPMMDVSRAKHGLFHWGGQSKTVDSLVAVVEIVWERELSREKQKGLE